MTEIETHRLSLRPTTLEYFDGLWSAIEESVGELRQWMPWAIDPHPGTTREFVLRAAAEWQTGSDRHFTLLLDGAVCGQCSLDHADPLHSNYEIGYWMRSDLCGRGLMTEAAAAVVTFGFEEMAAHRVELHAGTDNAGSIRVAEKLGFQREGILREASRGIGGFHDVYVYGLLDSDPRPPISGGPSS